MFRINKKVLLTLTLATTSLLAFSADKLSAQEGEASPQATEAPVSPSTFSLSTKGIKVEKNPYSHSSLDRYKVTLKGVSSTRDKDAQGEPTPYTLTTFLPFWESSSPHKVIVSSMSLSPETTLTLSHPVMVDEETLEFDGAFLGDKKEGAVPGTLVTAEVMEIKDPQDLVLTALNEIDQPATPLRSPNAMGELSAVKTGTDKTGPYVTLTFREGTHPEFESTPLKMVNMGDDLKSIETDISKNIKDMILDLAGNGLPFVSSSRIKSLTFMNKNTVRVRLDTKDAKQLEAITYYAKLHTERAAQHKGNLRGTFAVFSNYSPPPSTKENKHPAPKEENFFLFAKGGVTFETKSPSPEATHKEKKYYVTLHHVEKVVGVNRKGSQKEYRDGDIAHIIDQGKHPFRPNGSFMFSEGEGTSYVILSYDEAKLDPKTKDITFEVTFLQSANMRKGLEVVPLQFVQDKPVKVNDEVVVYFDPYAHGERIV